VNLLRVNFSTLLFALLLCGFTSAWGQEVEEEEAPEPYSEPSQPENPSPPTEMGYASFYHEQFHGRRTANGETFNRHALTAAHKTLPFGTLVRVINLRNERSVIVRVNDRGPLLKNRVIDLTPRAARQLGFFADGVTWVKLEVITSSAPAALEFK
jgi:rare lipoprotein A